jgi:hypothetical protein
MKRVPETAEMRLSGPTTGEQKLGEGRPDLPLGGGQPSAVRPTGSSSRTRRGPQ